jgi:hypothetical protein
LEEHSNVRGKLAEASEEGHGPRRAVESIMIIYIYNNPNLRGIHSRSRDYSDTFAQSNLSKNLSMYGPL